MPKHYDKKKTGEKIRKGFGIIGKMIKGENVVDAALGKKPKKKAAKRQDTYESRAAKRANEPPRPQINAGLRRHRKSIKDRELRPSVVGLERAQ